MSDPFRDRFGRFSLCRAEHKPNGIRVWEKKKFRSSPNGKKDPTPKGSRPFSRKSLQTVSSQGVSFCIGDFRDASKLKSGGVPENRDMPSEGRRSAGDRFSNLFVLPCAHRGPGPLRCHCHCWRVEARADRISWVQRADRQNTHLPRSGWNFVAFPNVALGSVGLGWQLDTRGARRIASVNSS